MIYFCHRPDPFRYRLWIRDLKAGLDPAMVDFNWQRLEGPQISVAEAAAVAHAMPMMSDMRVVEIHGLLQHLMKRKRHKSTRAQGTAEGAELLHMLASLPPETRLVLVEPEARANQGWAQSVKALATAQTPPLEAIGIESVDLATPQKRQLDDWIRERCRTKNLNCTAAAVRMLHQRVGHDLQLLDMELDKMAAYANGARLSEQAVGAMVADYREEPIWRLADAVFRQERAQAMSAMVQLLEQGLSPIPILATLGTQMRLLAAVKMSRARDQEIVSQMKVRPFAVQRARRNAARFSTAQILMFSDLLQEADFAMKSQPNAEQTLEILIGRLITPASWTAV